ncbi:MAG: DUF58 domain-containing protein [Chloroflexi bacterium]|nr:DUF58 domain-containing protein [Chloroflexota bacterium]
MKRSYAVLLLLAVTLVFGLATGFSLFYRLVYVLALAVAGTYLWTSLNLLWLTVEVQRRSTRAQVGDTIEERITIHNTGLLPKGWLEVQDLTDMAGYSTGMVVTLPSHGFRSWKASSVARRRGRYTLGPVRVAAGDPFGLFRKERRFLGSQELIVYPATAPLPYFRVLAADTPGEGPPRQRVQHITPHASSVRQYQAGDSLNRIHWPTTARLGQLMVKEFDLGLGSDLWVLVDLQRQAQAGAGEATTDEVMVTIAASITHKYLEAEMPVGLVAQGDRRYFLPAARGTGQLLQALENLALMRAEGTMPLGEVIASEGGRFNRFTTLVVITPSLDLDWVGGVESLAKRRVRVIAILVDPTSFDRSGSATRVLERLAEGGVTTYLVRQGDVLAQVLAHPYGLSPHLAAAGRREGVL